MNFINHAIASAGESQVGIVYLDLDNFKRKLMTPMGICLARSALTGRFAGAVELSGGRSVLACRLGR